ncbi:Glu/Leu/Phe/Val family dehydrogenase [Rhodococcus sp. ACT016]|uniref:Glu/Leu/Phe/Val family dehydrogenase n=1 Tax=Rhodococcus sp. ACT016 TaxID=3134808 RepID=UPI003D281D34
MNATTIESVGVTDEGHEQVIFCRDAESGLQAIIALYSTALGPGLGGTRFHPYPSEAAAIKDVLDLSKAMAYKAALAGLDLGGGSAVIVGDSREIKRDALLHAYGRFVQSLSGRYYTACDVGTTCTDMDVIARETSFAAGRSPAYGGAGDSSVLAALGVFRGMQASARHIWGTESLEGKAVGISGVGKVGRQLVALLVQAGAEVSVTDPHLPAVRDLVAAHPTVHVVGAEEGLVACPLDVFAPCALGGALTEKVVDSLNARIVCGAANNQLVHRGIALRMKDRGITYAPDYCVNAGGLIQVSDELQGFSFKRAHERTNRIFDTTLDVLECAARENVTTAFAADRLAEQRMQERRVRGVWTTRTRTGF